MDDRRFDQLARMMAGDGTRRRLLRTAAAGVAVVLGRASGPAEAAKCVKLGKTCKKRGEKLKCCGGATCKGSTCKCPGGKKPCGKRCVPKANCCNGQRRCGRRCVPEADCCTDADCPLGTCQPSDRCFATGCTFTDYCSDIFVHDCGPPPVDSFAPCVCATSRDGNVFCVDHLTLGNSECGTCKKDTDCPAGQACFPGGQLCTCLDGAKGFCVSTRCSEA